MKITQILYSGMGGHGSVAFSISEGDLNQEAEHSFIFYGIEDIFSDYQEKCNNGNHQFSYIQKSSKSLNYKELIKAIKEHNPTHIILHSTQLILPIVLYCQRVDIKLLTVEHQNNQLKRLQDKIGTFLSAVFSAKACLTEEYKNELLALPFGQLIHKHTQVIPNGINTEKFKATKTTSKNSVQVCMISRMNALKNHRTLVDAAVLLSQNTTQPVQFFIAGDGPTKQSIQNYIDEQEMGYYVKLLGALKESQVIDLLTKSDLYAHCTKGESMSMSVLQAMSTETPVAASNVKGINNLFTDNEIFLFEENDSNELVEIINQLSANPSIGLKKVRAAKSLIETKYSFSIIFNRYKDLLQSI